MITLFLFLFVALGANPLKPGDPLPEIKGELLSGHNATLPTLAKGKIALLALGFTRDSRHSTEPWTRRYRSEFGNNETVACYNVPMIGSGGRFAKIFIESGMKRDLAKSDYDHFLLVFSSTDDWKARVSLPRPDDATLILIDSSGTVRWIYAGSFDDAYYQQLAEATKRLLTQTH